MLAGPLLGLLYAFLLLNSSSPVLSLGLNYVVLGFLGPFHRFWALLSHSGFFVPFYSFGHPQLVSSLSGSFVPFYSFGHPQLVSSFSGSFVPFVFPWASQAYLLSLGFLGPFPNFALPWAFINFLGLLRPNYLILILGAHGLAINPLLSLFSLLWACRSPFSLFHIIYCPWFAFSLFPSSFRPIYLFKTHLFISWACDPLFLPFELNGFFLNLLTLFFPYCWASSCYWAHLPKWASTLPSFKGIVNDDDVCIFLFFIIPLLVSWSASWKFLVILDFYNGTHFFMSTAICILISSCFYSSMYSFLRFWGTNTHFSASAEYVDTFCYNTCTYFSSLIHLLLCLC